MKILLAGNAPWSPSGYGEQIALLTPRLQAMGHEVSIAANFGIQGTIAPWTNPINEQTVAVYPAGPTNCNGSIYAHFAKHAGADIILALQDSWTLKPVTWPPETRMALWAPVDHWPLPPRVMGVLADPKVQPIAMSLFGEEWMRRCKLDPYYAPHAVDTALFRPQPELRDVMRDDMGIPRDAFLIGMVAANKGWNRQVSRKAFPQVIEAFSRFALHHDDAWLYLHTDAVPSGDGTNLEVVLLTMDAWADAETHAKVRERVRFPSPEEMLMGLPREALAAQYVAFDVLLNPAMGEGFGVPVVEAQACGVPVIASHHSAMTELTQAGWLVQGDPWWDALQESFAFMPHIDSIVAALEEAYQTRDDVELREAAVDWAKRYDIDYVAERHWQPLIEKLAAPKVVRPISGKERKKQRKRTAAEQRKAAV